MEMEAKEKVELIQQLMEEQTAKQVISSSSDDHHLVLSGLLSQLETLNGEDNLAQPESPVDPKKGKSDIAIELGSSCGDDTGREEIIRELKKVQKQNFITHCLLSVMIALTVAWQLSEVTLVLKVKNGLSNPFKSIGGLLTGIIKNPMENAQIADKESGTKQWQIEGTSIPPLKIPEVPNFEFPLALDSDKH